MGIVFVIAGILAEARRAVASVESPSDAAAYSIGRSGNQLKWLPYRPSQPQSPGNGAKVWTSSKSKILATQYAEPYPSSRPKEQKDDTRDGARLFSDPFGDRGAAAPSRPFGPNVPSLMPNEPRPAGPLPGLNADDKKEREKPYLPPGAFPPSNQAPSTGAFKAPSLDQALQVQQFELAENCPSPNDLKDIDDLSIDITPSKGDLPHDCPLGDEKFEPRAFAPITYTWTASGLCHKPLYFEDVQLERYGHMAGPWLQPFACGAHFFLTFPILPYKMGLETPNECLYSLGYYRPGDCAPYLFDPIPLSMRAALFEAGAWVAGAYMIP